MPTSTERPTWILINCMIVWVVSTLATCLRLQVGALIWNPFTKQIVSIAYNGAPKGRSHCLDVGCEMEDGHCVRCLHGDTNALYWAGIASQNCWMFLNYSPCRRCVNHIIQGGIRHVVYTKPYGSTYAETNQILRDAGIQVTWFNHELVWEAFVKLAKAMRESK